MLKKPVVIVSILAVLLALAVTYFAARFGDQKAIGRAQAQMQQLREERETLTRHVAEIEGSQRTLQDRSDSLRRAADSLRSQVVALEAERRASQLEVRRLDRPEALKEKLRTTFPEMAASDWGVTAVMNEKQNISLKYLLVPLWFSETFIIDHQNSKSYKAQNIKYQGIDALERQRDTLQNRVLTLEREKSEAYHAGYVSASTKYEALNTDYINRLKKPRLSLNFPGTMTMVLGSVAAGAVLGVAATK